MDLTVSKRNFAAGLREEATSSPDTNNSPKKGKKKKKTFMMAEKTFIDDSAHTSSLYPSTQKSINFQAHNIEQST
jgi:hypothetical protein